jgi:hypothetical protein
MKTAQICNSDVVLIRRVLHFPQFKLYLILSVEDV